MAREPQRPKVEFLMAIAGPISSFLVGFAFYLIRLAGEGRWPMEAAGVLAYLSWINWLLAIFNLVPAFPLDGGRVLRSALWHFLGDLRRATLIASRIGSGFGILLMVLAFYQLFSGYLISAIWNFLIGMFLREASRMSYEQIAFRAPLEGEPVRSFMNAAPVTVPADISIRQLVDDYVDRYDFRMFPAVSNSEHLVGCVSTRDIKRVPRLEWDQHSVDEIMKPCSEANTVGPDSDVMEILSKMGETGASWLMVTDRDHLLAIVSQGDLIERQAARLIAQRGPSGLRCASH